MNIDYVAEARKKQEEQDRQRFQQARDPFQYGRQVAQRRYSEIMSGLAERQRQSARTYSDMYQAAKETATAQRAMGAPSLSGGMKAQYSDLVSAREMQQLGAIGRDREAAAREIDLQRQSAFANAELEGQQAAQTELQNRQTKLQLIQQKNEILGNNKLTNIEKAEQLETLGYLEEAAELRETPEGPGTDRTFIGGLFTAGGALAAVNFNVLGIKTGLTKLGGLAVKGLVGSKVPFLVKLGGLLSKVGAGVGGAAKVGLLAGSVKLVGTLALVYGLIYGANKLFDPDDKFQWLFEDEVDEFFGIKE